MSVQGKTSEWELENRLHELVKEHGNRWTEIARLMNEEGYRNRKNEPFTAVALRQRWNRVAILRAELFRFNGTDWTTEIVERVLPPDDKGFYEELAAALAFGACLEQAGKYLRRFALHHAEGRVDEIGLSLLSPHRELNIDFPCQQSGMDRYVLAVRRLLLKVLTQLSEIPGVDQEWIKREGFRSWITSSYAGLSNTFSKRFYGAHRRRSGLKGDNDNPELSPKPFRKRKNGHERKARPNIGGTIDPVLKELFDSQRNTLGITAARLLDTILWHWYGWPALSYENLHEIENLGIAVTEEWSQGSAKFKLFPLFGPELTPEQKVSLLSLMGYSEEQIAEIKTWPPDTEEEVAKHYVMSIFNFKIKEIVKCERAWND